MIHHRYEWLWVNGAHRTTARRGYRYDIGLYNGTGQLRVLVDRDHVAGDPPPNTDVPIARPVILFRMPELLKIRAGWSDATTGEVVFQYLDMKVTYLAYAAGFIGPTGARFDAVASDGHSPEPMS
jgi:hypothetical protein